MRKRRIGGREEKAEPEKKSQNTDRQPDAISRHDAKIARVARDKVWKKPDSCKVLEELAYPQDPKAGRRRQARATLI